MKMLSRSEALEKWKQLTEQQKLLLVKKYKPNWSLIMIEKLSSTIQYILNQE
jgi:hypothetical protein